MDERTVRDMLHKIASDEAPPSRVSIGLALRKGLRRRRTRRIYWSAGPPVAAAAAVALIAGLPQAFSSQNHIRPPATHTSTPPTSKPPAVAPRTFSQTEPFAMWGWLPSGMQAEQDDDTQTTLIEQLGVSTSATRANIQLAMNVAHACKLVRTTALLLECGLGTNGAPKLTKAPSIHGETAYWGPAGTLVWEYAKYGWAEINSLGVSKAHLLRVAATIRYRAVRYSYAFKFHGAPPTWRSLPEGSFDVVAGKPAPFGLSIGPVSQGQSALEIEVLPTAQTMYANDCGGWTNLPVYELPRGKAITIDGAKAVLVTKNVRDQHYQALCATDVHGLRLAISLYTDGDGTNRPVPGVGRLGGALGVFHHLSLLGTNVRNWTTNPLH
jgi:hypothetical protein